MIPFGNRTVTLLHRVPNGYKLFILSGCSWKDAAARTLSGTSIVCTMETTCRVPRGQQKPEPGDLMILGAVSESAGSEIELVRLMQRLRAEGGSAFRVERVKDNTGAPMPHYAASGA